ncbi:aromatic acid/H+ symport family MFS transporter [Paraburkholderia panacisoli]|uniref:Aromatic acid/H+ symport family MFS transporter n=1 Tax=Paraburkholderia panacisoli TaxID=2603818 RepID=A0A5B0GP70_9BURK|nr:aromatic acid/H+ symport family MFS transporter [Paraburkholderia panacisoli]KAA1003749.1 aromatic acid/H+ symport family MFS transporter [Paraburkholderia panacisoli]
MDTQREAIDLPAFIDANRVSRFQIGLLILLGLTVVIDGFDVQSMGFVAPAIIQSWGVNKAAFGPVFGAGLLGMLFGSLALSVVADKVGRRPVLIGATLAFSVCMLATSQVSTMTELLIIRFVTGLGLGAIMPNAMALAGEFSPKRKRVTLMMWVSCGFTLGAVLGGLIAANLIPLWGWQSVFIVGGIVPLVLAILMFLYLPESMVFSVVRGVRLERVAATLLRIDPAMTVTRDTRYVVPESRPNQAPVVELFHAGRAKTTLLLWAVNFMNLLNLYFLSNWLPTIARSAGLSTSTAILVGTALQLGGVAGTVVMGPIIDRVGFFKVLIPAFLLAAVSIATIGRPGLPLGVLIAVVGVTGLSIIGAQPAVNALAATYYPTSLRSTGIGWSLGIGRIGSIVGPVIGGELIRMNWPNADLFMAVAVPAAFSALMLMLMARGRQTTNTHAGAHRSLGGLK